MSALCAGICLNSNIDGIIIVPLILLLRIPTLCFKVSSSSADVLKYRDILKDPWFPEFRSFNLLVVDSILYFNGSEIVPPLSTMSASSTLQSLRKSWFCFCATSISTGSIICANSKFRFLVSPILYSQFCLICDGQPDAQMIWWCFPAYSKVSLCSLI